MAGGIPSSSNQASNQSVSKRSIVKRHKFQSSFAATPTVLQYQPASFCSAGSRAVASEKVRLQLQVYFRTFEEIRLQGNLHLFFSFFPPSHKPYILQYATLHRAVTYLRTLSHLSSTPSPSTPSLPHPSSSPTKPTAVSIHRRGIPFYCYRYTITSHHILPVSLFLIFSSIQVRRRLSCKH